MKIIGAYEEICAINCFLLNNHPHCCEYQQPWRDLDGGHYSGKWKGFDINFEIVKKPMIIGIIVGDIPEHTIYEYARKLCDRHNGLERSQRMWQGGFYCDASDNTHIKTILRFGLLRGQKLDELWINSLPSNWDEFDLCMSSVIGDRSKIHFYKELENEVK